LGRKKVPGGLRKSRVGRGMKPTKLSFVGFMPLCWHPLHAPLIKCSSVHLRVLGPEVEHGSERRVLDDPSWQKKVWAGELREREKKVPPPKSTIEFEFSASGREYHTEQLSSDLSKSRAPMRFRRCQSKSPVKSKLKMSRHGTPSIPTATLSDPLPGPTPF